MSRFFANVSGMLVVRGVLSILFGVVALAWPGITLTSLVALFGAFALVDGIVALVSAVTNRATPFPRWVVALDGFAGIAAGLLTFFFPAATALALLYIIAVWALVSGSLLLGAAVTGPRFEPGWLMALDGIVSILFGISLIAWPGSGILAIVWALGLYTVVVGVWSLVAAYRVHRDAAALEASPVGQLFRGSAA